MNADQFKRPYRQVIFDTLSRTPDLDSGIYSEEELGLVMRLYDMLDDGLSDGTCSASSIAFVLISLADAIGRSAPQKLEMSMASIRMMQVGKTTAAEFDEHAYKNNWPERKSVFIEPISTDQIMGKKP